MIYISVFDNLLIGLNIAVSVCLPVIPFLWCCMTMFSSCCNNSETNVEDASSHAAVFMHSSMLLGVRQLEQIAYKLNISLPPEEWISNIKYFCIEFKNDFF